MIVTRGKGHAPPDVASGQGYSETFPGGLRGAVLLGKDSGLSTRLCECTSTQGTALRDINSTGATSPMLPVPGPALVKRTGKS